MEAVRGLVKEDECICENYVDNDRHEIIFETVKYSGTATIVSISYACDCS
jgi:hypothetical protein